VQYAHARICSVLRNAARDMPKIDTSPAALVKADFALLSHADELALLKEVALWPRIVETAARAHEPHRIAFYLYDLAAALHGIWNKGKEDPGLRFLVADDENLTAARLGMIEAVRTVIASGLSVMGVEPVREMH